VLLSPEREKDSEDPSEERPSGEEPHDRDVTPPPPHPPPPVLCVSSEPIGTVLNLNYFTEMCSGSEAGSYLWLIDFCITQLRLASNM